MSYPKFLNYSKNGNRARAGQAHGTPFNVSPLSNQHLGFRGDGIACQLIITGDYDSTSDLDKYAHLLIEHLQQVIDLQINPSQPSITEQAFQDNLNM